VLVFRVDSFDMFLQKAGLGDDDRAELAVVRLETCDAVASDRLWGLVAVA